MIISLRTARYFILALGCLCIGIWQESPALGMGLYWIIVSTFLWDYEDD